MLEPYTQAPYEVCGQDMVRVGTPADGSCFFHAVYMALSPEYREMTQEEKVAHISREREHIAEGLTLTSLKSLGKGVVWELVCALSPEEMTDEERLEGFRDKVRTDWVDEFLWELLQDTYRVNFIVIQEHRLYKREEKYPDNVFLLWVDHSHYEPLAYRINEGQMAYVVNAQHPFLTQLHGRDPPAPPA